MLEMNGWDTIWHGFLVCLKCNTCGDNIEANCLKRIFVDMAFGSTSHVSSSEGLAVTHG